jgi:hypothetical protein
MSVVLAIISLTALVAAVFCIAMALWHAFGMVRGVRASSEWWVQLVPFLAFAVPGALDSVGQLHRAKFARWGIYALLLSAIAGIIQLAFQP